MRIMLLYLFFLVAALIFTSGIASANTYPSGNAECRLITTENGSVTVDQSDPNCADTIAYKKAKCEGIGFLDEKFSECAAYNVIAAILNMISGAINYCINLIMSILTYTPDISGAKESYDKVLKVVQSLYSLLISILGLYWIFGARSYEGRVNAKIWAERVIAIIIIESVGFFLFSTALKLNSYISSSLLSNVQLSTDIVSLAWTNAAIVIAAFFMAGFILLTALVLIVRQFLIFIMLCMFPFTLMLFLLPSTRQWGSFLMNITMLVIFIGSVDVIMVYAASNITGMAGFFELDGAIKPLATITIFALIGMIDIWLFLSTVHFTSAATTVITTGLSGTNTAAGVVSNLPQLTQPELITRK